MATNEMGSTKYLLNICCIQILFMLVLLNPTQSSKLKHTSDRQPNIILMVADDMGWNDIGYTNNDILSPNLDKLAKDGIILNNSYMLSLCTPSRAALLSGYYPYRTGMQHGVLDLNVPGGLPTKFRTIGDRFRQLGYATHIVGKWDIGFCNLKYTPLQRGFDSFFGYYQASEFYYNHTDQGGDISGYDFRNNTRVAWEYLDVHSSIAYVKQATQIIATHDTSKPLFLYLPSQLVHAPIQIPQRYVDLYKHSPVKNPIRRQFQGTVSALDDDIGHVVAALKKYGLYENSVIAFTSDNGGHPDNAGSNYPLRGWKGTLFEGGNRVPGFFHSPLLKQKGYVYNGLMHATDWMPTLLSIAGGQADAEIDGINMWPAITQNGPSPRVEMVYNIDNTSGNMVGAIRNGPWKLTIGEPGNASGWIPPEAVSGAFAYELHEGPPVDEVVNSTDIFLFNLETDPTEHHDLKHVYPNITNFLMGRFNEHVQMLVPTIQKPADPCGDPKYFNGVWSPGWCPEIIQPGSF